MPGTAITKSVVTNEPGGRKRDEIFVDVIEKISVTFNSSVSILIIFFLCFFHDVCYDVFLPFSIHRLLQNFEAF